jgi:dolichol-phosphate mannosyltransferase
MKLSVVSPVYYGEGILEKLVERVFAAGRNITDNVEIILVNDCSPDNSWEEIKSIAASSDSVIGLNLSKNFGQSYAISAGLSVASGDWVVIIDCDLQDTPEEIPNLFAKALEGYDVVQAQRVQRNDRYAKKLSSKIFYAVLTYLTGVKHDPSVANFGIYSKKLIDVIVEMPEHIRYFPTMVKWAGFKQTSIPVTHNTRESGVSGYNWKKLFRLAIDIILANSDKPMRLTIKLGFSITILTILVSAFTFILWLNGLIAVRGYTSLLLSVWLLSGVIIFVLGILGLYIGKTFEGVKRRPYFIISERV